MTLHSFFNAPSRFFKSAYLALVVVAVYVYFFMSFPSNLTQLPTKPQARPASKTEPTSAVHAVIPNISLSTSYVSRTVSDAPSTQRIKAHSSQSLLPAYTEAIAQPIIQVTEEHSTKTFTQASQKSSVQPHLKPTNTNTPMETVANTTLGVR